MSQKRSGLWAFFLPLLFLGGCMVGPQQQRMERDFEEMKRRLADLERSVASRQQDQELAGRMEALGRQQADLQAGLDALRVEIQSSRGRQEDAAQQARALRDELSLLRDDLGLKVAALEGKVKDLADRPVAVSPPPPVPETAQELYEKGLALIQKEGAFAQGQAVLRDFLQRYPKDDLAVNAMYWIGEAFYGEKKYENAILQFQDVITRFPDHPKTAAALLKQGLAFQALGDVRNARVILQKLIDTFPASEEAAKAKEKLAQW
jgi:tol-pal system protein YbgF